FENYPYTLSGGQQQLVTILRALITKADLILLDEPFSSLDYQTTLFMLNKTQEIWQETGITFIFVSHDIDEAIFLSQRLILLSKKPTMIAEEVNNILPYPRTTHIMGMPEFSRLKHEALDVFIKQVNNKTL
ncbi:MAG: ATP-binding cassette domain-containing protein, partial [Nanoarchaeota archaeon]